MLFLLPVTGYAQEVSEVYVTSDTLQVFFRQNRTVLDTSFRDNGRRLREFSDRFAGLLRVPGSKVRSILVVSGASPEGPFTLNQRLSDARARAVIDYLLRQRLVDSSRVEVESRGADWKGLRERVEASDLPYREEVIELIDFPLFVREGGRVADGRKQRLMDLQGGKVWRELYDRYFRELRGTKVMIAWNILREDTPVTPRVEPASAREGAMPRLVVAPPARPVLPVMVPARFPLPVRKKKQYIAIESNLLLDAAVIPNIGIEVGIGKGFTIGGNYQNIWLRDKAWTRWYRLEGFEVGLNRYLNREKRPFRGHHVGLYGQLLTWDFTVNGKGYLAERWARGGGVAYGYAFPVGRRFNLDFEIGVGYLGGNMHEYTPEDGHRVWQRTKPFHWVGPTKAGITLQWLAGRGNVNERRGRR